MQESVHQSPVFDCRTGRLQVKLRLDEEEDRMGEEEEELNERDLFDFVPDLNKLWYVV